MLEKIGQAEIKAITVNVENSADRRDRLGLVPRALEQNPQRFQHIALIIGN